MWATVTVLDLDDPAPIERIVETGDQAFVPVLVELFLHPWVLGPRVEASLDEGLHALTGESYTAPKWREWVKWVGRHDEVAPPPDFAEWKSRLYSALTEGISDFLYRGVESRIRIEEIVWGGVPTDGIPDLRRPPHVSPAEASYLRPEDRVFGVSINGEHRAYPLRILNAHEMANDVLGGEPLALAY